MSQTALHLLQNLGDSTRLRLLHLLAREELMVGELVRALQLPQSTVSRHLKHLEAQGWLERRAQGTHQILSMREDLEPLAGKLWEALGESFQGEPYPEDLRRMEGLLAQRAMNSREFFTRQGQRWDALRRELFGESFLPEGLASLLDPDTSLLDLGCGTGATLRTLAPAVRRAVGVDREEAMLDLARRRLQQHVNVSLHRGGVESLPLKDDSFDLATCVLVLHHVEDLEGALSECWRVLKPGGALILVDMVGHQRSEYRRTMGHQHLGFSRAQIQTLAEGAGLLLQSWRLLPIAPDALGPGLFSARLSRPSVKTDTTRR